MSLPSAGARVLVFDEKKCVGCRRCEYACSDKHTNVMNPACARIHNFPFRRDAMFVTVTCMQCEKPVCAAVCPVGAISRSETGAMVVNEQRCLGCRMCVMTCPFGGIMHTAGSKTVTKCDLCDGSPACAGVCPTAALTYEESRKATLDRRKAVADTLARILG